jgi:glycosyltransferase involved in cell wall biosynthesis
LRATCCPAADGLASQNGRCMSNPAVSVIVPMHNAAEHVLDQVTALANQAAVGLDFEVIWVDNGSDDGTFELVTEATRGDARMRVISASELRSSYFARNEGVATARGEVLLFCDADDVVDDEWVRSMTTALADWDLVAGALQTASGEPPAVPSDPVLGFLPAAPTASLAIRRRTFESLGGFESSIPHGGDTALCWNAQVRGLRFGYAPEAVVLYRRKATEWARVKRLWTQGRWYRYWAEPFVSFGAPAPTIPAAIRRTIDHSILPAFKHPSKHQARGALWNIAVIARRRTT